MMTTAPTTNFAPTAHHPLGPSNLPMFAECACYEAPKDDPEDLEPGADDEGQLTAKGRGTAKHKAVAMLFSPYLAIRQRAFDGLSETEANEVRFVVERVVAILTEHGLSPADLRVEQRVTLLRPDAFEPLYFGTGDGEAGALSFDWKFGDARNYFPQLCGYDLPRFEATRETRRLAFVVYGRLKRHERYVIDRMTAETVVFGILNRRLSPHRRPTPCQYCSWCAARLTCPAFVSEPVALVARREDWALKLPTPHASQLRDPAWLGAARFVWKSFLEPWGEAVEFQTAMLAASGVAPAGYKIRPEKGRTTIADTKKAFDALSGLVGEDVLWDTLDVSIGPLAKAYAAKAGISEEKAKAAIVSRLADARLLAVGPSSTKLIKDKDAENAIRAALAVTVGPETRSDLPEASAHKIT